MAAKHGLHSCICRKKPFISEVNKDKRVQWAKDNADTQWRHAMYTDEAAFRIGETSVERCLRRPDTQYHKANITTKFRPGPTMHVWDAIVHGKKLPLMKFELQKVHTVKKVRIAAQTITAEVYAEQILAGPLLCYCNQMREEGVDVLVVEDGAPAHFGGPAGRIRAILPINNQPHPPSSPDLNPIEECWRMVKEKLRCLPWKPTNLPDLWEAIQVVWNNIEQSKIDGMIDSMGRRQEEILRVHGQSTGW
jgi:hypothetical protein